MSKCSNRSIFVFGLLCFVLAGPGVSAGFASEVNSAQEFIPSAQNVKLLGRTHLIDDTLWLALPGTGIEFTFTGTKAEITLIADNVITTSWAETNYCRVGIYVNDKLVIDTLVKEDKKVIPVFESATEQLTTIKVVKYSEAGCSTVGIGTIKVTSKGPIQPAPAKERRIEFIGDSITCGYGIEGKRNQHFSSATENVTKTYAVRTASDLNADYSVFAAGGDASRFSCA